MKICSNCGHQNDENAKFCAKCAVSLAEEKVPEMGIVITDVTAVDHNEPENEETEEAEVAVAEAVVAEEANEADDAVISDVTTVSEETEEKVLHMHTNNQPGNKQKKRIKISASLLLFLSFEKGRIILLLTSLVFLGFSISNFQVRVDAIPAVYEEVTREIDFVKYDPYGEPSVDSYIDVININSWFQDVTERSGSVPGSITHTVGTYYVVFNDDMEMGFIQLQKLGNGPRIFAEYPDISLYSDILYEALDSGEIVLPAQRIYGSTRRMMDMDERIEMNPGAWREETRSEIESNYELLDVRVLLQPHNDTTRTEKIEVSPPIPASLEPATGSQLVRPIVLGLISLLFLAAFIFFVIKRYKLVFANSADFGSD